MKAINIERDEKAIEAAKFINEYCKEHDNCKYCIFSFSHVCILKWTDPDGWNHSISKVYERRMNRKMID